jgi:hypothetical protein
LIFLWKETKKTVFVRRIYIDYPNKKYFIDFDSNYNFEKNQNLREKNELVFLFEEFDLLIISWICRRVRLSFIVDLFSDGRERQKRENIGYNRRPTKMFGIYKTVFFLSTTLIIEKSWEVYRLILAKVDLYPLFSSINLINVVD